MKKLIALCFTACVPLVSFGQANGITLNLENENPLSKWGRWTYFNQEGNNYAFNLSQNRKKMPMKARWSSGNWVVKLNKDMLSDRHDLFFGLKVSEARLGTTSVGCMSNADKAGQGNALCGVQLDMRLR